MSTGKDYKSPLASDGCFFSMVCFYSRFPIFVHVPSTTVKVLIAVLDHIFSDKGIPETVDSDNGPPIQSHKLEEYFKTQGITHRPSTPLWPEAKGSVENLKKWLNKILKV